MVNDGQILSSVTGGTSAEALAGSLRESQVGHALEFSAFCFNEDALQSLSCPAFIHRHQRKNPGIGLNPKLLSLNTILRIRMLRSTFYPEYAVLFCISTREDERKHSAWNMMGSTWRQRKFRSDAMSK